MKKIALTIDGKTVEIDERNIFSVMDMMMAAGQAMFDNKNFSQNRDGISLTFSVTGQPAEDTKTFTSTDNMLKKLEEFEARIDEQLGVKKIWL
ncbi:hypothetical protein [Citrobacter portucalensis]|uniref:hypothetical protein n=1 Tax=Citrobacter portucalensis TaxID=1639133 RepID=UPI00295CCF4F|nr:hypothetical protein [Citrobacter freundii]